MFHYFLPLLILRIFIFTFTFVNSNCLIKWLGSHSWENFRFQGGMKLHILSLWYDLTWEWTLVSWTIYILVWYLSTWMYIICLTCQTTCTVKHILIECRAFAIIRKRFFKVTKWQNRWRSVLHARNRVVRKNMTN